MPGTTPGIHAREQPHGNNPTGTTPREQPHGNNPTGTTPREQPHGNNRKATPVMKRPAPFVGTLHPLSCTAVQSGYYSSKFARKTENAVDTNNRVEDFWF